MGDAEYPREALNNALTLFSVSYGALQAAKATIKQPSDILTLHKKCAFNKARQALLFCTLGNTSASQTSKSIADGHFTEWHNMQMRDIETIRKPDLFVPKAGWSMPHDDGNKYTLAALEKRSLEQTVAEYQSIVKKITC